MTDFTVDGPIEADVRFGSGHLTVTTTEGTASATCEALDPHNPEAVEHAARAEISLQGKRLRVELPTRGRGWQHTSLPVHVRLAVPEGSTVASASGELTLVAHGRLQDVSLRTGTARLELPEVTGALDVRAGTCDTTIGTAGRISIAQGAGALQVRQVGDLTLKAGACEVEVGSSTGQVVVKGGSVSLELASAGSGEVVFVSGAGSAAVGVVPGTTVKLDLTSGLGDISCELPEEQDEPAGGAALRLRLKTGTGDLRVTRAVPAEADAV